MNPVMLKETTLENRGGLAVEITGKYESMRHALARADSSKVTAGEAASLLKKKGFAVKACELIDWWRLTQGRDPEWHHAGKFAHGMGKTFFFSVEVINSFSEADMEVIEQLREKEIPVFRVGFIKNGKAWIPVAQFVLRKGRLQYGDQVIEQEDYEQLQQYNGIPLKPYESFEEFKARMLAQNKALEANNK